MAILRGGGLGGGGLSASRLQAGLTLFDIPGVGWWSLSDKSQLIQPDIVASGIPVRILDASAALLPTDFSDIRSTTATYTNSSGVVSTASANTLRTNYSLAGVLLGDLIEPAATNLALRSSDFTSVGTGTDSSHWNLDTGTGGPTLTSTGIGDPTGGTSGAALDFNGSTTSHGLYIHLIITSGTTYTFSLYVRLNAGNTRGTQFRLTSNNSLGWNTGISTLFTATSSWQRFSISGVISNSNNLTNIGIDCRDVAGTYDSNVTGKFDVWGGQLETGSVMTSHIPTTTATVTRAADAASFTLNSAATQLTFTFDDGSTQTVTGLTGGATYNIPTSLNRPNILYIDDNSGTSSTVSAIVDQTLGGLTTTAAATAAVQAVVNQSLGALSQSLTAISLNQLNPVDKDPSITLSNNNLTATGTATPGHNYNVRGTQPGSTGRYFEVTFSTIITSLGVGLANLTQSLGAYTGDPNGAGWFSDGYAEWPGSGFSNNFGTFATGDVLGVLLEASDVKFYNNGTLVGTASSLPTGSLYPIISLANNTDSGTVNFGATALSHLPTGATSWDGSQTTAGPTAVVNQTLGALTQAAPVTVSVAAVAAQTLGSLNQSLATTVVDAATAAQTLGALTQTAASTVKAAAAAAQTLGALGQTTTETVGDAAAVAQTLGALGQTATDAAGVATTVAQTLGALGQTLTSVVASAATTSQTLGALSQTTTAAATDTTTTSQTLGALTQTSTAIHTAANAVVNQTLGALGQTAAVAAQDAAAVAQTLGALQQAVTSAAAEAAATAQTLGALQQLSSVALVGGLTTTETLGALQQTAAGAAQVNALVSQLMDALGQTAAATIVGNAVVDQTLDALGQAVNVEGPGFHVTTAQTLGDLSQTALATVGDAAAIAQNFGAISQQTATTVDVLATVTQALGELAQTAIAAPPEGADFILAEQTMGVLQQLAAGKVTIATVVSQVLSALAQRSPTGVLDRATVSQVLQGLQQAASVELPVPTTILPETVISVMYEHRILVVPSEARTLVVPGMYAGVLAGGLGELTGPVTRLPGEHLLPPLRQAAEAITRPVVALPDNIITLEEDILSALLWEDGTFFAMEDDTVSVISIDNAVALEEGGFLLTEANDTFGLEDVTVLTTADNAVLLEDGYSLLTEDGFFLGVEDAIVLDALDSFVLEDGSGFILLEDGDILTLEPGTSAPVTAPTAQTLQTLFTLQQVAGLRRGPVTGEDLAWTNQTLPALQQGLHGIVALGSGPTTFNPNDKSPSIVLSNGNLTLTGGGMARGTKPGQINDYFEFVFSSLATSTNESGIGVANLTQPLAGYMGNPNGVGYFGSGYAEWPGSGFATSVPTFGVGDVLGIRLIGQPGTGTGGTIGPVAWNPSDKHSNVVLSNGNFTATATANTSSISGSTNTTNVRATVAGSAGRYFEMTWGTGGTPNGFGLATLAQSLSVYSGNPAGIGFFHDGYVEWPGSGFTNNWGGTFAAGDIMGVMLVSLAGALSVQLFKNGALVYTVPTVPIGALYPIFCPSSAGENATANFGATPLAHLPVRATSWDGSQTNSGTLTATWNPSDLSGITLSNGNLTATGNGTGGGQVRGTLAGTASRYYEVHIDTDTTPGSIYIGLANTSQGITTGYASNPNGICYFDNGYAEWPGSGTSGNGATFTVGDVIGVELLASSALFFKNGALQFTATLPPGSLYPIVGLYDTGSALTANFGNSSFTNLPSGAVGWNT